MVLFLSYRMLAYIDNFLTFTTYCFVVRGLEALGASAYATASYVFVVDIFPDNIGSVLVSISKHVILVCLFSQVYVNIHYTPGSSLTNYTD
jgi:hypothetical protein